MILIVSVIIVMLIIFISLNYLFKKERFKIFTVDTIDSLTNKEVYSIIDSILDYINKKYSKKLISSTLDRAEKTINNERDQIDYKISIFVFNKETYSNKKMEFDVSTKMNKVVVNSIKLGGSRPIDPFREGISGRGSKIVSPHVNMGVVQPYNINSNQPHNVKLPKNQKESDKNESLGNIINRHSWILDEEAQNHVNEPGFPAHYISVGWDKHGVENMYKDNRDSACGFNHSYERILNQPKFIISNFVLNDTQYQWMFDTAQDSASRPVGITGATGS